MRNQTILVDINKETCKILKYKQYDNNNILQIIVEENYKKINLNEYIGFAFFELPSGLIIKKECEIEDNVITIIIDNNVLSEEGKVLLDLTLSDGEDTFTLFRINLVIEGTIDRDEAIIIEAGWDIVAEIAKFDKAEEQRADYESVRIANEADRQNEEMKRIANEKVRVAKESDRQNEEMKRIANEKVRVVKEDERLINEQGRIDAEELRIENEELRVQAEASRVTAEQNRVTRFNEMEAMVAEVEGELEGVKNNMSVNPDSFNGSDVEKLQQAVDYAINNNHQEIILYRVYDITGGSVFINKSGESPRKPIYFKSLNGGIEKHDAGFFFTTNNKNVGELFISDMKFMSTRGVNSKVYDVSKIIRINSIHNYYSNIDYVYYDDNDYAQTIRSISDYYVYINTVCKIVYGYDLHFSNCLCEESNKFLEDDEIKKHNINNNISITDCVIENTKDIAIKLNGCHSLNISNNYFELNSGYIKLGQYGSHGCNISSNFFYDNSSTPKACVYIEGGNKRQYTMYSNYVSGQNLILVSSLVSDIKVFDLANTVNDGSILTDNDKIIKTFDETANYANNHGIKTNCGIRQFHYAIPYFEKSAGETIVKNIENIDNVKQDDLITISHENLAPGVTIEPPKVTDSEISLVINNTSNDVNGCHIYVNVLRVNDIRLY